MCVQAQELAEMDEEFGIADLISEVVQEDKSKVSKWVELDSFKPRPY